MPDQWLAFDKVQHFVACFVITALVYAALGRGKGVEVPTHRRRLGLACAAGFAVGISKEVLDAADLWPTGGAASLKDLTADALGCLAAAGGVHANAGRRTRATMLHQGEEAV